MNRIMETELIDVSLKSQFETLPNEVILHLFRYLKIVDLARCGQVSKRLRAISNNEQYLWPKNLNLSYKKVPTGFLQKLLDGGCKYLSLSGAISEGTLSLPKASRLVYLNLSGFQNRENSEKLIKSCYSLQKLSLSKLYLSSEIISIISLQNGKTLKVLDLSECILCNENDDEQYRNFTQCGVSQAGVVQCAYSAAIQQIVENCTELVELSLHMTKLCKKSVDILCSDLTSKIEKLDLFDMVYLSDNHVEKLVTRCNKITELNLGGWKTSITKLSLNFIIEHLQFNLVKLNLLYTDAEIYLSDLFELKSMLKLAVLCYDPEDWNYIDRRMLRQQLPNIRIYSNLGTPKIAIPCPPLIISIQEIWEIKSEREELFSDHTVSTLGSTPMGPRNIRIMGTDGFWKIRTNSIYSSHEAFKNYVQRKH